MIYNQDCLYRFEAYLTTERKASQHTVIAYKTDLLQFVDYLVAHIDQKLLTQVTLNDIRGWIMTLAKKNLMLAPSIEKLQLYVNFIPIYK